MEKPLLDGWHVVSDRIANPLSQSLSVQEVYDTFDNWQDLCSLADFIDVIATSFASHVEGNPSDLLNPALVAHWVGAWAMSGLKVERAQCVFRELLVMLVKQGAIHYTLESALHGSMWQLM